MTGKSILLLIFGFAAIYGMFGTRLNTVSVNAVDNMSDYFEITVAKNIASSGANMMANKLFLDETYEGVLKKKLSSGATLAATLTTVDEFTELKVIESVCEFNDVTQRVRITVRPSKFSKFSYFCENEPDNIWWYGTDTIWGPMHVNSRLNVWQSPVFMGKVTALKDVNIYDDDDTNPVFHGGLELGVDKRIPQLGLEKLKDRAEDDGKVFKDAESVTLEFLDDEIKYTTGSGGFTDPDPGIPPVLQEGWISIVPQSGVLPNKTVTFVFKHELLKCSDFDGAEVEVNGDDDYELNGCELTLDISWKAEELEIEIELEEDDYPKLNDDEEGKAKWDFSTGKVMVCKAGKSIEINMSALGAHLKSGVTYGPCDDGGGGGGETATVDVETLAPNGVIYVDGGDLRIKGRLDGRVTVAAGKDGAGKGGTIYLDDDIIYKDDPRTNSSSNDMLGICAQKNVYITDNNPNNDDIVIHGAIYCESGGFGAENYDSRGFAGDIHLLGGITQMERLSVGTTSGHGFWKKYKYDKRLMDASPPAFPGTGGFEVVSWYQ